MIYDNKQNVDNLLRNSITRDRVDKSLIKIRENKRNHYSQNNSHKVGENKDFCYKMYNDWIRKDSPVDIPILIMDNDNLIKNKDIDIIPRLYSKYAQKNINIPFIFENRKNKYTTFKKYFKNILNKDIPNSDDFKYMLINKKDFEKNHDLFESINIFLYTSFLLKQFSTVMNLTPYFYSPIRDETKYYFYIVFDYMRRECIRLNKPLMKNEVINLIKKVYSLNNQVLTKKIFLNTFNYIDVSIFDSNSSFNLINENEIFYYELIKNNKVGNKNYLNNNDSDDDSFNNSNNNSNNNNKNIVNNIYINNKSIHISFENSNDKNMNKQLELIKSLLCN